ncbi:hypothetical protein MPSEU_000348100 [Mayamaea pseudoterrestris]|nr:hypothetical protein MPSEU_000348100 [Mayamaea pseudoterrestris]
MSTETIEQDVAFDKVIDKGEEDGLFRSSMKAIRRAHFQANRLRAGLVLAGLLTDKLLYRDVITLFYVVTRELEKKLDKYKDSDENCRKLLSMGYHFTEQYEQDMAALYSPESWKYEVELASKKNPAAELYLDKIRTMTNGRQLAGAAFVLWGALIIGGGAAVQPRVEKLCGKEATHVFQNVIGPGRAQRRNNFIQLWDSLADQGSDEFHDIISEVQECMKCNNDIFMSVQRNPWWFQYVGIACAGLLAIGVCRMIKNAKD